MEFRDFKGSELRPGLYTWGDNPVATVIVSRENGNYRLTSTSVLNPELTPAVARRLRPLTKSELRAIITDTREITWLNIQSRRSRDRAEAVQYAFSEDLP